MATSESLACGSESSEQHIRVRLEALKLISDWSKGAILIQTAGLGAIGALLKGVPNSWMLALVIVLFAVLISSIYLGAVAVAGTIPYVAQALADNPMCDIYAQKGGIKRRGIISPTANLSLGMLCIWQARLFTLSIFLFAVFALIRTIT